MKKFLAIASALSMLFLTSCESDVISDTQDESSSTQDESSSYSQVSVTYADKELGMKKLIFSAMVFFPASSIRNNYYLFVQSDGSIYTGVYTDCMAKLYEFPKRLAECDDSAFDLLDDVERIGEITASEAQNLVELINNIDPDSDGFDYETDNNGMRPAVIDTALYTSDFYLGTAPKSRFHAASSGTWSGSFTRTYDENASKAMKIIGDTELFKNWAIDLEAKYAKYGDSSDEPDDADNDIDDKTDLEVSQ